MQNLAVFGIIAHILSKFCKFVFIAFVVIYQHEIPAGEAPRMKTATHFLVQKVESAAAEKKRRMCGNKIAHETLEAANAARQATENRHGWAMNVYPCRYCGKFHVGWASKIT